MSQNPSRQSYRGVLCMSCRQPIPLPEIVVRMESLLESQERELPEQTFSLRCRACNREKPYRSRDIVAFEGEPRLRPSLVHRGQGGTKAGRLSRAANG